MIIDVYHAPDAITLTAEPGTAITFTADPREYFASVPRDVEEVRAENHRRLLEMNPSFFDEYGPATARPAQPRPQLHRSGRRRTATATRNWRRTCKQ